MKTKKLICAALIAVIAKALTDEQWTAVLTKLTTALDTASKTGGQLATRCSGLFDEISGLGIDIILVETTEYNYYKIASVELKILLNANYVINATAEDLLAKVTMAINAGVGDGPMQE